MLFDSKIWVIMNCDSPFWNYSFFLSIYISCIKWNSRTKTEDKTKLTLKSNYKNGILWPDWFWPNVRKNCSSDQEKLLRLKAKNFPIFEITRTIYSNSEWLEQFLVTEWFFNLFLEVSQISKNWTIIIQIGKKYWDLKICRKS